MAKEIQPIFILPEGSRRDTGKNAQRNNIMAAKAVADVVRSTLGPKGMDKMLVDSLGEIVVTNDGVTILEEMSIQHPTAKMVVEIAKTQEKEVGDGTTTAVILAGELLKKSEELLDMDIHPTVIVKGYRLGKDKALELLEKLAVKISTDDEAILLKAAQTSMTGKGADSSRDRLAALVVKAVRQVADKSDNLLTINKDDIKLEKKVGESVENTELIEGIVIDKERVHTSMPKSVKEAKIALIDSAVEVRSTETDAKIQITDPNQMQAFLDMEERMIKKMVDAISNSGATAVFCQKGIDDIAQHFLAKNGIYAVRRVKKSDMERLSRATGARIVSNLEELSKADLGYSRVVEESQVGDEQMTFVRGCKTPKSVTILIRGGTEHVVAEAERAIEDAVGVVMSCIKSGKVVGGAGSIEMELALRLRQFSETLSGREQLAVRAFAESMEIIPRTLAENAGLEPIDILAELKSAHNENKLWSGINVFNAKIMDAWREGVIEPMKIKTQALSSATEVSTMILRIDDVIASESKSPRPMPDDKGMDMQ